MAPRSWLRRVRNWVDRHPWLTTFSIAAIALLADWMRSPRRDLGTLLGRGTFMLAIFAIVLVLPVVLNLLLYRSTSPTRRQLNAERRRADEIAASVRDWRERGGGL